MNQKITPKDLPHIKGQFNNLFGSVPLFQASALTEETTMTWVSPDLTTLITQAAQSLPETGEEFIFTGSGLIIFGGETGVTAPMETNRKDAFGRTVIKDVPVIGLVWRDPYGIGELVVTGLTHGLGGMLATPIVASDEDKEKLLNLVRTAWLLTGQEDLADEEEIIVTEKTRRRRGKRQEPRQSTVKIVRLRKHEREYEPPKDSKGVWKLDHRVVVSGHWRNTPYGPRDSGLRRPTYIRPYIKGPDGERLVLKPTVQIWD